MEPTPNKIPPASAVGPSAPRRSIAPFTKEYALATGRFLLSFAAAAIALAFLGLYIAREVATIRTTRGNYKLTVEAFESLNKLTEDKKNSTALLASLEKVLPTALEVPTEMIPALKTEARELGASISVDIAPTTPGEGASVPDTVSFTLRADGAAQSVLNFVKKFEAKRIIKVHSWSISLVEAPSTIQLAMDAELAVRREEPKTASSTAAGETKGPASVPAAATAASATTAESRSVMQETPSGSAAAANTAAPTSTGVVASSTAEHASSSPSSMGQGAPAGTVQSAGVQPPATPADITMQILNGTGVTGLSKSWQSKFEAAGFAHIRIGNAGDVNRVGISVAYKSSRAAALPDVYGVFEKNGVASTSIRAAEGTAEASYDIVIVLGKIQ